MGNKSSSKRNQLNDDPAILDGNSTVTRAIARGRVYVVLRYPKSVGEMVGGNLNETNFRKIMRDLQQVRKRGHILQ